VPGESHGLLHNFSSGGGPAVHVGPVAADLG